ncbi:patatin-like protein [Thauera aromatica]|uniref:patatin-like protein n=1 Tax=Thauera aromatica TaxID=59405 RepID=UPI001FFCB944|nr:patatin-like protein [Thauera aromatica]MCK2088597.1 patatin-like protein [Thauera aromatica]
MKEKELRLALVLFGGVSLAIYQHGINREVLNLARASKAYHDTDSLAAKQAAAHVFARARDRAGRGAGDEADARSAEVYFDLLKRLGRVVDLRVLVDVVSGSSAGAVNGIALARALAHDLSLETLTTLWLEEADMQRLIAPEARAKAWNKWYFRPLLRPMLSWLRREGMLPATADHEMAERVLSFVRSRWFNPPLDGTRLSAVLLDGLLAMEEMPGGAPRSLLPSGTQLSLAVTVTDYHGIDRTIFTHDPPMLREREHRHVLQFSCENRKSGVIESDFGLDNAPSLAFAARASASYPGAFPPARMAEMDALLAARGMAWPTRERFLERNFGHYREQGMNPEELVLLDGSVLDNKPIMAAARYIRLHRAFREVDRRLIFIDPHAAPQYGREAEREAGAGAVPGWFETLRGALSDLPRQQPVHSELAEISRYNRQIRRLKAMIVETRPQVEALVEQATAGALGGHYTLDELRHWRLTSTNLLATSTLVYNAWWRALVLEALDFVAGLLRKLCGYSQESPAARWLQLVVEEWAACNGVLCTEYRIPDEVYGNADMPRFARMVIRFGIEYKRRRINFVLHELNALYQYLPLDTYCATDPGTLDEVKAEIHECLDGLAIYDGSDFIDEVTATAARALLHPGAPDAGEFGGSAVQDFVLRHGHTLGALIERLGDECGIAESNANMDAALASPRVQRIDASCRRQLLTAYLGYFYWDVILRPALGALALGTGPLEEVLIDRISPEDATTLAAVGQGQAVLFGTSFGNFGGFLSRKARENDYLWGRLHAADRLIDIVAGALPGNGGLGEGELRAFKKRAFEAILVEEAVRLQGVPELIARVKAAVAAL